MKMQQVSIAYQVGNHLTKLVDAINEVKAVVEAETYGMDPSVPLVTLELVLLIKVQIQGCTLETGAETSEIDDIVKEFDPLHIDFSKLTLSEVYDLQQAGDGNTTEGECCFLSGNKKTKEGKGTQGPP